MPIVRVSIEGISPFLQHGFGLAFQNEDAARAQLIQNATPREQAESVVYRNDDGTCYFPGAAISRLIRESGANHKLKGSRKSVRYVVPAAVIVPDDHISLLDKPDGVPLTDYEVDSRPVTIPATKGRIMRHRPRFDVWGAEFVLEIDDQLLPVELVHQLVEEGGRRIGVGDFRPEKGGPFGRFGVVGWN